MQQGSTLVFTYVKPSATGGTSQREKVAAAWRKLQSSYGRADRPKIFATYYEGAFERVSAAEPVTSFEKFRR